MTLRRDSRPARGGGFTLIEAAVSIVIVGVMIVAALQAVGSAAEARRRSAALRTADDLIAHVLAEISSFYFEQPLAKSHWGPGPGEKANPRNFNDLDDFDGLTESPPTDRDGKPIDGFGDWKYTVAVTPVQAMLDGWEAAAPSSHLRLVEVEVRSTLGILKSGSVLLSRQGTNRLDPSRVAARHTTAHLRFKTPGGRSFVLSTPMLNTPEAP